MKRRNSSEFDSSRRNFIKTSLLSAGAFFVSISPLKAITALETIDQSSISSNLSLDEAKLMAKNAKELFYKKEYDSAKAIYQRLIEAFPDHISFYDGYGKLLRAQNLLLDNAELYREGMIKDPQNPYFLQRLSISIRRLCTGNNKEANNFTSIYGINSLYSYAMELMIEAVKLKPNDKGLNLDLIDFCNSVITNLNDLNRYFTLTIPENQYNESIRITEKYQTKWNQTRASRKPFQNDIDVAVERIKNKPRRHFYFSDEKNKNEKDLTKSKIEYWRKGLRESIENKQIIKTSIYGMLILKDDIRDTETIGLLRKNYRKNKDYISLITLNRFLYVNDQSVQNTLSLASSLSKYGTAASLAEVLELLSKVKDVKYLPPVYSAMYYISYCNCYSRLLNYAKAREIILEGIKHFEAVGGIAYVLLENYALTFSKIKYSNSVTLLKALSGKEIKVFDDPIWKYIVIYQDYYKTNDISIDEQLKPLYALAKIQQKKDASGYKKTLEEIQILKLKKDELS